MTESLRQEQTQVADAATPGWTLNKTLLALGAAGPVLFLVVSTLLGLLDPNFDVMTEPVSALAFAWVTITAGGLLRNTGTRARQAPCKYE